MLWVSDLSGVIEYTKDEIYVQIRIQVHWAFVINHVFWLESVITQLSDYKYVINGIKYIIW